MYIFEWKQLFYLRSAILLKDGQTIHQAVDHQAIWISWVLYTCSFLNFFPIVCVKFPSFFLISKIHGHKKHKKSSGSLPSLVPRWCPLRSLLLLNRGLPGYWIWMWRTSNIWHRWPGLQPPPHETAGCSFFGTLGESWCSEHGLELITNLPYKWNIRVI